MDDDLLKAIIAGSLTEIRAKYAGAAVSITNPIVLLECAQIVGEQYVLGAAAEVAPPTHPPAA